MKKQKTSFAAHYPLFASGCQQALLGINDIIAQIFPFSSFFAALQHKNDIFMTKTCQFRAFLRAIYVKLLYFSIVYNKCKFCDFFVTKCNKKARIGAFSAIMPVFFSPFFCIATRKRPFLPHTARSAGKKSPDASASPLKLWR